MADTAARWLCTIAIGVLVSTSSVGQSAHAHAPTRPATKSASPDPPEEVARRGMVAMNTDRFDQWAALMHPEVLRAFQRHMLEALTTAEAKGRTGPVLAFLGGAESADEVRRLSPEALFARVMAGVFAQMTPETRETVRTSKFRVLGTVREGDDLAHVVVRLFLHTGGTDVTAVDIINLKRHGAEWRMLYKVDHESFLQNLKRQLVDDATGG